MFRGGKHYIWCSPAFEGAALQKYAIGAAQPPSSDPASIYRTVHDATRKADKANANIAKWRATLSSLAQKWYEANEISESDRDEIVAIVANASWNDWRPLIYVVPFHRVAGRVRAVGFAHRASKEPEYIVEDLSDSDFEMIEPWPWN